MSDLQVSTDVLTEISPQRSSFLLVRSIAVGVALQQFVPALLLLHFSGDFQPVLAKHSKHFSLRFQSAWIRYSGTSTARKQVDAWGESQLSDVAAKLIIDRTFIESDPGRIPDAVSGDLYRFAKIGSSGLRGCRRINAVTRSAVSGQIGELRFFVPLPMGRTRAGDLK